MNKKVFVTGATGHLGQTLCPLLIANGYQVLAGVRKRVGDSRAARLAAIGAKLVELDVLKPALLKDNLADVDCVFHLAAIYQFAGNHTHQQIKKTAINGTLNVLAATKSAGVTNVIMTSSTVAVGSNAPAGRQLNESNWNTTTHEPYAIAKTVAELEAYKYCEVNDIKLNTICPAAIIGPNFENHTPTTLPVELALTGKLKAIPPLAFSFVDVRDVAKAHLLAYEKSSVSGRYIASSHYKTMTQMVDTIRLIAPDIQTPRLNLPKAILPALPFIDAMSNKILGTPRFATKEFVKEFGYGEAKFSNKKLSDQLGWQPRSFEESMEDTINWIITKNKQIALQPQYS